MARAGRTSTIATFFPEAQEPPPPQVGIWDDTSGLNPIDDWSIVYMPYCDGSVFSGDNDVFDPAFGAAIGVPQAVVRFHRGLRNVTAGIDLARSMFPHASRIMLAGSSAGGVGAAGFCALPGSSCLRQQQEAHGI